MIALPLAILLGLPGGTPPTTTVQTLCVDSVGPTGIPCGPIPSAPGPAPVLGVAAGLHWSRKIRRRIAQATKPEHHKPH